MKVTGDIQIQGFRDAVQLIPVINDKQKTMDYIIVACVGTVDSKGIKSADYNFFIIRLYAPL